MDNNNNKSLKKYSSDNIRIKRPSSQVKKKNTNDTGFFFIGDGIIDNLFHFLWIKDHSFGSRKMFIKLFSAWNFDTRYNSLSSK